MVNHTRLDCVLGVAAGMRWGTAPAIHHCTHREAFGKRLAEQPLMRNVLADLAIESEAATVAAMRIARAFDEAHAGDEAAVEFRRLANAGAQVLDLQARPRSTRSRRWSAWAATATSRSRACRGSTGRARWPRSGRGPGTCNASTCCAGWRAARSRSRRSSRRSRRRAARSLGSTTARSALRDELADLEAIEARARGVVERMALALQASLLVRYGDPAVADAFCASRLAGDAGLAFGTLPSGTDFGRIIERHSPGI